MAVICPTVTAFDLHGYREQVERLLPFAERIHVDLMDGIFASTQSPPLDQIWVPDEVVTDIHLMYQQPMNFLDQLVKLAPHLVIFHAEAEVDHIQFAIHLREHGIKVGLAILQTTSVESVAELLSSFDHVLVFSGDLGHHGGQADLNLLEKVHQLRQYSPGLEIGWDGGINDRNAKQLVEAGVDVLNVGGFIQKAKDPQEQYKKIERLVL
jgi:ribulose-phosphate 3-epimerase